MAKYKKLKIRPYARLLTMLGEQLIKNERIALIELIKNAYDADSPWVKISFVGFDDNFRFDSESKIVIEDSGCGMNAEIIEEHWLNPATPEKLRRKAKKNTTPAGRIIQGEKGVGCFAILKLGRKIKIITRAKGENVEHVVDYDFSKYDDDFLSEEGKAKNLFIDDLSVSLQTRNPKIIRECLFPLGARKVKRSPHGTRIEISELKGSWSEKKVEAVYRDIARLESIFSHNIQRTDKNLRESFEVRIYKDEKVLNYQEQYLEKLHTLLFDRMAAFYVQRGVTVPLSSAEFYAGLAQCFPERGGMYFLPEQVAEYDKKRMKAFRLEAVRAGFKKAWQERDYTTIIAVARKIPDNVLQEDPKLLMWYDQAVTRVGGE